MNLTVNPAPRQTSPARAETARINGALSRGPVTEEGRARSSRNSLRHGLTAKAVVLETESKEEFAALLDAFLDRFQPSDPVERELVEAMAAARWRLRRLYAIESTILDNELMRREDSIDENFTDVDNNDLLAHAFQCLSDSGRVLANLVRYEGSLNRAFDRAFKQLIQLQSVPRPTPPPVTPDAALGSFRNPRNPPAPPAPAPDLRGAPDPETPSPIAVSPVAGRGSAANPPAGEPANS